MTYHATCPILAPSPLGEEEVDCGPNRYFSVVKQQCAKMKWEPECELDEVANPLVFPGDPGYCVKLACKPGLVAHKGFCKKPSGDDEPGTAAVVALGVLAVAGAAVWMISR